MAEVEVAHRDVATESFDQVTATLEIDSAMTDVQVTQRVAVDHEPLQVSARTVGQGASRDVEMLDLLIVR